MPNRATLTNCCRDQRPPRLRDFAEKASRKNAAPITRSQATLAGARSSNSRTAMTAPQYWPSAEMTNKNSGGAVVAKRFSPREAALELNRKDLGQCGRFLPIGVEIATNLQPENLLDRACNLPSHVE